MPCHNLLWAQNLPLCLPPSLPPSRLPATLPAGHEEGHVMRMLARPLHRPRGRGRGRLFPLLPQSVRPSFLPCSKSGVISEYLSYTHCLALIYNPATRQTDRRRGERERRAGTIPGRHTPPDTERRARLSGTVGNALNKFCPGCQGPRNLLENTLKYLKWASASVQEGLQSGLGECTQDKMAKLFDGGSCSTRQIGAAVNSDELGFAGCTPVRRDAVIRVHREFAIDAK